MYRGNKILAIIPARGGSKGLKQKNILKLLDKPLIAWTIEAARRSSLLDRVIVSSDDRAIIRVAERYGCDVPFIRPAAISTDKATSASVVLHALNVLPEKYDYVVLLQPTSPLRITADIDECVMKCVKTGAVSCVTVTEPEKSPFWMFKLGVGGFLRPLIKARRIPSRRQDAPKVYSLNGAVYVADRQWFMRKKTFLGPRTVAHEMPAERSLDIDTALDFCKAEYLLRH